MAAVTLLVIGDSQLDGGGSTNTRATDNMNLVRATAHDYTLQTGDVTNNWTSAQITDADTRFKVGDPAEPWHEMHSCLGNHEYDYAWSAGWNWMSNCGASSSAPWHSFDTSNGWHIICTDANGAGNSISTGSTQYNWIVADLQANAEKPTLILAHWGRYSGCSAHGSNTDLSNLFAYCLASAPWVEAFISGHQHQYECFSRMNNSGAVDTNNGIRQFTMAATGQTASYTNSSPTGLVYYANSTYTGVTKFTLDTDHYDWETIVPNGYSAITDTGTQTIRYPLTSGPQNYTQTPADGAGLTDSITIDSPPHDYTQTPADGAGLTDSVTTDKQTASSTPQLAYSNGQSATSGTSALTCGSAFTPNVGDVIVVKAITEDASKTHTGSPTSSAGSLSFGSPRVSDTTSQYTANYIWVATVGAGQNVSMTISTSSISAGGYHSAVFERWTGAKLDATPATCDTRGSGAPSTTLTTEANNSVVTWSVGDWSAVAGTSTWSNGADNEYNVAGNGNNYGAHYATQEAPTAGSQSLGMSAPTGQKYTILGIEIQASSTGTPYTQAPADDAGLTDTGYLHTLDLAGNDPFGLTDSVDTYLETAGTAYTQTPADDEALTDAVVKEVGKALAEDAGLTDTRVIELIRSDGAGLVDAAIRALTHPVADDTGLADSPVPDKPKADSTGLVDAVALTFSKGKAEDAGLVDAVGRDIPQADDTFLDDLEAVTLVFARSVSDDTGLADSVVRESVRADSAGLVDTVSIVCTYNRSINDDPGLADARVQELPRACPMGMGDVPTATVALARMLSDDTGNTDATTKGTAYPDSAGLADALTFTLATSIDDDSGLTDTPVVNLLHFANTEDSAGLNDNAEFMTTRMVKLLHVYVGCDPS